MKEYIKAIRKALDNKHFSTWENTEHGTISGTYNTGRGELYIMITFRPDGYSFVIYKPNGTKKYYSGKTYNQTLSIINQVIKAN